MEKYGTYQGRWLYSCAFDEILKAHTEKTLDPTIIYVIIDRSKVGTKFLYYKGMMVGTLVPAVDGGEKILFYQTKLCAPFEIWAAKELANVKDTLSEAKGIRTITERPTVESLCDKTPEVGLGLSDLAQSLLDGVGNFKWD